MKKHHLTLIATALLASTLHPVAAQDQSDADSATPSTTVMRMENIQIRHDKALTELGMTFDKIAKEPQLINTKDVVAAIDQGERTLKSTKTVCDAILATLKTEAKTIKAESSFSETQQTELLASVESLNKKCGDLAARTAVTIKHLEGANKAMSKWRKIYKTYLNLDGEAKATEQVKASVEEFVKGLTAEPDAAKPADGKKPE